MHLVNFSHPLDAAQVAEVEALVGAPVEGVADVSVQFDDSLPYGPQAEALADGAGLSASDWQTRPLLLVLPGHSLIAATLMAVLHGRTGHFPAVLRLRRAPGPVVRFTAAEVVGLQDLRERSRLARVS